MEHFGEAVPQDIKERHEKYMAELSPDEDSESEEIAVSNNASSAFRSLNDKSANDGIIRPKPSAME